MYVVVLFFNFWKFNFTFVLIECFFKVYFLMFFIVAAPKVIETGETSYQIEWQPVKMTLNVGEKVLYCLQTASCSRSSSLNVSAAADEFKTVRNFVDLYRFLNESWFFFLLDLQGLFNELYPYRISSRCVVSRKSRRRSLQRRWRRRSRRRNVRRLVADRQFFNSFSTKWPTQVIRRKL